MKSFRSTAVLAFVVGLIAAYTVYDYKKTAQNQAAQEEKEKLFSFKPSEIEGIKIVKPTQTFALKKVKGHWRVEEPFQDEAEEEGVTSYLNSMANEKGEDLTESKAEPKKEGIQWKEYGLDVPGMSVELHGGARKISFQISQHASFDGRYFVRQSDRLYLGSSEWGRLVEKTAQQLRNKIILREQQKIQQLVLTVRKKERQEKLILVREGTGWSFADLKKYPVDSRKVDQFIENLRSLKAMDYLEGGVDKKSLEKNNLQNPALQVDLKFVHANETAKNETAKEEGQTDGAIKEWHLSISQKKDNQVFGFSTSVPSLFKILGSDMDRLKTSRSDFRDGQAPFRFKLEQAHEIQVRVAKKELQTFKKEGTQWVLSGGKTETLDSQELEKMLQKLSSLEAQDFIEAKSDSHLDFGWKSPQSWVSIKDQAQKTLLELTWGKSYSPATDKDSDKSKGHAPHDTDHEKKSFIYVKSNLDQDVLGVPLNQFEDIPFDKLIRTASTSEAATKNLSQEKKEPTSASKDQK